MARAISQAGVLAVRGAEVLLITSRSGGRWVIPKGWVEDGLSARGAAAQEAWEEAGVRGRLSDEALGRFRYRKQGRTFEVTVFRLEVEEVLDDWPERGERRRAWLAPEEAARRVEEPGLRRLLLAEGREVARQPQDGG